MTRVTLCTANTPGAVAVIQLHGRGAPDALLALTGRRQWPERRAVLCRFAEIDEGLAVLVGPHAAQLMPHGGPRVVHKLIEHLTQQLGCDYDPTPDTRSLYPEAGSQIEADVLDAIARAASPAAIDLLAKQPQLWALPLKRVGLSALERQAIAERSRTLDKLITPPTVVVVGPANAGKSTLTNALMGRAVSIVADLPGTTRDWVGALVELSVTGQARDAVAVNWLDTPGLRESDDPVEQRAIALARKQIERADVLIAMRGVDQDWPELEALPRDPGLWVINKADDQARTPQQDAGHTADAPLLISALNSGNLDRLQALIIQHLGLDGHNDQHWAFSEPLKSWCAGPQAINLAGYIKE